MAERSAHNRRARRVARAHGSIEVVCGPMFSGKSEELIRRARRAQIAQLSVAVFKPAIDDRYDRRDVVSHAGARIPAIAIASAATLYAEASELDVVAVDEAQFLDDAVVDAVSWLANAGARVIVAGLDLDYRGLPFGRMPLLLAIADEVQKLAAVCHRCGGPATLTQRLRDGEPASFYGETIVIGALDQYEARCRACFEPGPDADAQASLFDRMAQA